MTIQSVPLSSLETAKGNPRKSFDPKSLEGLAASIKTDGLLQNLVVAKSKGNRFRIISGERRFRALKLLAERGEIGEAFQVPVEMRGEIAKDDALRIATVENLQRQNLTPLEEASALTKLIRKGEKLQDVITQTGLSESTIRRRVALTGLCREAKNMLEQGDLSLAQAEALTLGADELQRRILEEIEAGRDAWSPDEIKETILDGRPSVAMAIFDLARYEGGITTDLFAEGETSYFDDADQFFELQREAVAALESKHNETAAWVEVTTSHRIIDWKYEAAEEGQPSGVVINLSPSGLVEVREGLVRFEIDDETAEAVEENPAAPAKERRAYSGPLCRYIGHHKTLAVQELLIADARKGKEVAALTLLSNLRIHRANFAFATTAEPQSAYRVLEAQALLFAQKLGLETEEGESVWHSLPPLPGNELGVYEALKGLSDHELDGLIALVAALSFGQVNCDKLDGTMESVFNRVACDLDADMRNHWQPDRDFFEKRTRDQLLAIAAECGCAERYGIGMLRSFKKSELIGSLLRHLDAARKTSSPDEAMRAAREWLPGAMLFPAVDPKS